MSRHRLDPPPRVRPRYGRIGAVGLSVAVTLVALLGGIGVIPVGGGHRPAYAGDDQPAADRTESVRSAPVAQRASTQEESSAQGTTEQRGQESPKVDRAARADREPAAVQAVPDGTGQGKRVVFSISDQRVWLVDPDEARTRSYPVSGSLTDNLDPGSYKVYSRSRWAVGIEDSGVMEYFVRFTRGDNAAIGFHSIPTKNGRPLQSVSQLGTPQSHGCIRQKMADAKRMWRFAPVGTSVVVVA